MNQQIKCPKCGNEFEMENAISNKIEKDLREKIAIEKKQEIEIEKEKMRKQMNAFLQEKEKENKEREIKSIEDFRKKIVEENDSILKSLKEENERKNEKLKELNNKEIELIKTKETLQEITRQHELDVQKMRSSMMEELTEKVQKDTNEKFEMERQNFKIHTERQNKLIEELKRKSEQGSMELQGETQEIAIEELIRQTFIYDEVSDVPKGIEGADIIMKVKNNIGQECGSIVFESKRTKAFSTAWIDKLKKNMRDCNADIAVLVTNTLPKDWDTFGNYDGVWVCKFSDVKPLVMLLRESIIKVNIALKTQENKGDKMQMLYNYLTGIEFNHQLAAIVEGFQALNEQLSKEKIAMQKQWKEREKQIEKVLESTASMYGSIKGIAGNAINDIQQLELGG